MPAKITLEVSQGPMKGKVFTFEEHDTFIFGRARDCHARLSQTDTTASRHHFLLELNPPDARVRDLGSLNGTYVNGRKHGGRKEGESPQEAAKRTFPEVDLRDKDKIGVGETVFVVRIRAPAFCCRCRREIPDEFREMCKWIEGALLCPPCREQLKKPNLNGFRPEPERCNQCGKNVTEEIGVGRSGDYLCETCRTTMRVNPVGFLVSVLVHQREESKEEAVLSEIAGYGIERMLGRNEMGAVYLAHRKKDGRTAALKILLARVPVNERSRQLWQREIEKLSELHHSNIVELLDFGSAGTGFFFAREFCAGGSLEDQMRQQKRCFSLEKASSVLLQCLDGLRYAHARGKVHGSIKPQNILFEDSGVKLADFGLAKSFDRIGLSGMTATTTSATSFLFTPREYLTSFRSALPGSDVWCVAAVFNFMLTGHSPRVFPAGQDPLEVVLRGGKVPLRDRKLQIPRKLSRVIDRALADHPKDRYPSAEEFYQAVKKAL